MTWVGKETRPKLEPRILLPDDSKSHAAPLQPGTMWDEAYRRLKESGEWDGEGSGPAYENLLIHGDNLLALKALEQEYTGQVNCVYIDPPYNTGQAFEHYDDSVEHSIWLTLMKDRLEILYRLLADDGLMWVQLDDSEVHYCKVLLDEIFGRSNFVSNITYERSGAAGLGLGGFIVTTGETILLYKKGDLPRHKVNSSQQLEPKTMKRYNKALINEGQRELVGEFQSKSNGEPVKLFKHTGFAVKTISLAGLEDRFDEIEAEFVTYFEQLFRTNQIQKENAFQRDLVGRMDKSALYTVEYIPSRGKHEGKETRLYYLNAELFAWLRDTAVVEDGHVVKTGSITNVWTHDEIPKADMQNEGGVDFPRSKKPEQLLSRIIEMSTQPGDLILDSFAGSGTTGAVAHKLGRRWIMVELGEHCNTHSLPRLRSVIDGIDSRGVTKTAAWKSGGGFRFATLAPSMLKEDKFGNQVINPDYNPEMLAEAMCKHLGFTYAPSRDHYWMQGQSSETDFLFVTTQTITQELMAVLSADVGDERTLLICCSAWRGQPDLFPNLTLKKIPPVVLSKCEWGQDDYSSFVSNLKRIDPDSIPGTLFDQDNLNAEASL